MNKKIIIGLIMICLVGLVLGFVWIGSRYEKGELPKVNSLCVDFEIVEGEVNCQEAIDIALEKYPGEVKSIKKEKIKTLITEDIFVDVWLVELKLKKVISLPFDPEATIDGVIVSINRYTKDIKIYSYVGAISGIEKSETEAISGEPTEEMKSQILKEIEKNKK